MSSSTTARPKILIVLTSSEHGWYLPELAHPYEILSKSCDITIASPLGGPGPLDQSSVEAFSNDPISVNFHEKHSALWQNTSKLSDFLGKANDFAAIFYVGGYGPMFDLVSSTISAQLILEFHTKHKILSGVCHGPAVFSHVKLPDSDIYLLAGHKVTGISDHEIATLSSGLEEPFSVEQSLNEATGGGYEKASAAFGERVVVSKAGNGRVVITGQNPASGLGVGKAIYGEVFGRAWEA